jgi:uncharacterized protein (DUF433 family)
LLKRVVLVIQGTRVRDRGVVNMAGEKVETRELVRDVKGITHTGIEIFHKSEKIVY